MAQSFAKIPCVPLRPCFFAVKFVNLKSQKTITKEWKLIFKFQSFLDFIFVLHYNFFGICDLVLGTFSSDLVLDVYF